jgi:teichoic acid transport system ATP-binding protein
MVDPELHLGLAGSAGPDPSLAELSVRIRDLEVNYAVYEEISSTTRSLVGRFRQRRSVDVHALKGISVDFLTGQAIGIIGSNGSGKSTLLRTIAGLQPKSAGSVHVRGEAHLLGVNAALKSELSGFRNVMLGGLAMGLSQEEVRSKMDELVDFSGLGDAMGRPMRTYSSGMRARLTFSIATLRTPEILLIDEALAVGDRSFRAKSLEKIRQIQRDANSVVMVTHNLNEIRETCTRVLWLDQGRLVADGDVETVLESYESSAATP